jgi:hypothetical protein
VPGRHDFREVALKLFGLAAYPGGNIALFCDKAPVDRGFLEHGQGLLSGAGLRALRPAGGALSAA